MLGSVGVDDDNPVLAAIIGRWLGPSRLDAGGGVDATDISSRLCCCESEVVGGSSDC